MRIILFYMAVLLLTAPATFAQSAKVTIKNFEGIWQVTKQRYDNRGGAFLPAQSHDFKIYDEKGNFRHIIFANNRYMELSNGNIEITSDSTYTEKLVKHLAFPNVKEGKITFRFLDDNTFLMKWFVNGSGGEEVYERVRQNGQNDAQHQAKL